MEQSFTVYCAVMDNEIIKQLVRSKPDAVPTGQIPRALRQCDESQKMALLETVARRKPKSEHERSILLSLALRHKIGGILFLDMLGAFRGQRPS